MNNSLIHYGMKERSGRYPYGSGDDPFQRIKRSGFSKNQKKKIIKKAQQEIREKSVSEMTDKELKTRMDRMKLETDYERQKSARDAYTTSPQPTSKPSYYGKAVSEMSDDELQAFITRLRLEQQVAELTKKPETKKGKSWLASTLENSGKAAFTEVVNQAAVYALGEGLNKATKRKIYVRKGGDKKK